MHTRMDFVERLDGFRTQGQEFFIRRQGHRPILRWRIQLLRAAPEATTLGELHQDITTTAAVANCPRMIPLIFLYQPN
jgi:hypothetical protein